MCFAATWFYCSGLVLIVLLYLNDTWIIDCTATKGEVTVCSGGRRWYFSPGLMSMVMSHTHSATLGVLGELLHLAPLSFSK